MNHSMTQFPGVSSDHTPLLRVDGWNYKLAVLSTYITMTQCKVGKLKSEDNQSVLSCSRLFIFINESLNFVLEVCPLRSLLLTVSMLHKIESQNNSVERFASYLTVTLCYRHEEAMFLHTHWRPLI